MLPATEKPIYTTSSRTIPSLTTACRTTSRITTTRWRKSTVPWYTYLIKRVSSRVACCCFSSKTRSEMLLVLNICRDSAIRFLELSQRLGIPFLETERYFVLVSDFLLNTTCLEKNTCGHHCRKKTPADLDWTFSPLLETNLARSGWYVFRWSLCGKGGSLQQLWCLLYHWGCWGYTSEVGLVYLIKRIVWIRENLFDIFWGDVKMQTFRSAVQSTKVV